MDIDESSVEGEPGTKARHPTVQTFFFDYEPPFDAEPIVRRMLDSVPSKYLVGLREVVITNASGLDRKRRATVLKSRRRKVRLGNTSGLYHGAFKGKPAWIEIFLDNALRGWERSWLLRIPLLREGKIADVLFHELGHHIHFTCRPEYREKEDVADVWKVRLQDNYNRQRFSGMRKIGRLIRFLLGPLFDRYREKTMLRLFQKGLMSRAEFEEQLSKKTLVNESG